MRPSVVSVATGAGAHVPVMSAAAADVSVVVAEVAVASGIKAHVLVVSGAAAELSVVAAEVSIVSGVVVAEVSIASGAGVPAPAVFAAAADPSAVVAEVSVASGAGALVLVVSAVPELSVVIAEPSGTGEGGTSPRAGAVNRDAQSAAANTAAELPSISAYSPWLRPLSELRVSHLTSGAQGCAANRRADRTNGRPPFGVGSTSSGD